ncbi:hypothetical protein P5705_15725 [Pseudomonas entomophila]|uniref:hypothetical protein n=1 Tax=Pseudomonas entomophila TaxID=312306 RepID=UPI0024066D53|nr:hypothetical protein [Pseudomonas entomophila]MDF9619096.1 hypothetical protein [Pseudomonas entomophila]
MFDELIFEGGGIDPSNPYLGGGAYLPGSICWPLDRQGNPKLHLACFPLSFIEKHSDAKVAGSNLVSIFVPYSKSSDDYIDEVMEDGGEVLIYAPGDHVVSGGGEEISPAKLIMVVENAGEDSDENGVAKIGGVPCWLQDEEDTEGLSFALQINSSRLNKAAPSHKGILVGGLGILMIGEREGRVEGRFIVQTT